MRKYYLEIVVFTCGASVMILELLASRILAPFVGTSSYVWTSIIGIILGSLSLGYWLGGKLADKQPKNVVLAGIIFSSAIFIGVTTFINIPILFLIQQYNIDLRIGTILATLILFAFPSVLLGMVSPYAVKLKMINFDKTGATVGSLYALSTMGSIVGTFVAGFILIPYLGSEKNLLLISIVLIITSILVYFRSDSKVNIAFLVVLIICITLPNPSLLLINELDFIDIDTQYSRVWIYNAKDKNTNKDIKVMQINNEYSSAMFVDSDDLVFDYTKYYNLAEHFNPEFKKALMIGGAAYSYPRYYLDRYPNEEIDVVEIDPKVTEIAKKRFRLVDNPRLRIIHEDGRVFLNNTKNKYDVFYGDAFRAKSVPYQLTTLETANKIYNSLNENGVVLINIISSIEGNNGKFLRGEYATYKRVFPQVYIFPINNSKDGLEVQNLMLVALKSESVPSFNSENTVMNEYLDHLWTNEIERDTPILTDDFSPVEYYMMGIS